MQAELAVPAHLDVMGDTVIYSGMGQDHTIDFPAISGTSAFSISTEYGITEYEFRTFMFPWTSLDFGNGKIIPQRGDVITDGSFNYVVTTPQGVDFYSLDSDRVWMTVRTTKTNS